MAHIHFTGELKARAEEDACSQRRSFYVRLTDSQSARAYLPARDATHARRIADAINGISCEIGTAGLVASTKAAGGGAE